MQLTAEGTVVDACLRRLTDDEIGIFIDKYVIMPNHIHVIVCIDGEKGGQGRPPLQRVIQRFKSISTRLLWNRGHKKLWQRSYYDHVIRNEADYLRTWQYIDENPARWAEDEYYVPPAPYSPWARMISSASCIPEISNSLAAP